MAEAVAVVKHGNIREREKSGLSDNIFEHKPDEIPDDVPRSHAHHDLDCRHH
jgi:hypothetical protein